ncbi:hypothetical protein PHLCEN_2v6597 [Hermanssonia centrifuga]|uniref:Uncharacterized protein n=1 Tax=Hermanssonia centrifuga TaxID=98765 RepID=A0A2R6NYZ8_9APHY|nr:hypothetical protein PHLCEN_2v6597 [Hermanssonia centrifuga]
MHGHLPLRLDDQALATAPLAANLTPPPTQLTGDPAPPACAPSPFNGMTEADAVALWNHIKHLLPVQSNPGGSLPQPIAPPEPSQEAPPLPDESNLMVADPAVIAHARAQATAPNNSRTPVLPAIEPGFMATSFREYLHLPQVIRALEAQQAVGHPAKGGQTHETDRIVIRHY